MNSYMPNLNLSGGMGSGINVNNFTANPLAIPKLDTGFGGRAFAALPTMNQYTNQPMLSQADQQYLSGLNTKGIPTETNSFMRSAFGGTDANGMYQGGAFLPLMQGLGSLAQGYLGFQQLGLAQDQFKAQQDAYNTNLANQVQLTNNALYDREKSRAAWESREPTSKEEFLKLEGIKA